MASFYCDQCERYFKWKVSLKRHKARKTPCRKAMYSCSDCNNGFVSHQSLSKHKALYCKWKPVLVKEEVVVENNGTATLSDILDALYNRDHEQIPSDTPIDTTTTLSDLLNTLMNQYDATTFMEAAMPPPPPPCTQVVTTQVNTITTPNNNNTSFTDNAVYNNVVPINNYAAAADAADDFVPSFTSRSNPKHCTDNIEPLFTINPFCGEIPAPVPLAPVPVPAAIDQHPSAADADNILYCFDQVLLQWMDEILQLEGKFANNAIVKGEVARVVDRLLQDGLLSCYEHGQLTYVNHLFIRLHDLIHMNMHAVNRREIVGILANLFEMNKISKTVFVEMCVNI